MEPAAPLSGVVVAERGGRLAAAVAGTLLGELGATVLRLEDAAGRPHSDPPAWHAHPVALEGKQRFRADGDTGRDEAWAALCAGAHVALVSDPACIAAALDVPLTAVVTAFGADAPDIAACELAVQARSGAMATTGPARGAPCAVRAPLLELLAGVNTATSVLAALRAGTRGILDLALFDSALALAGTFHPQALADPARRFRNGSRHTLCAPWNSYRTSDAWVTICIASDDQWTRFANAIGRADLAQDRALATSLQRLAAIEDVDTAVTRWTQVRPVADVVHALRAADLPVSAVATPGPDVATVVRTVARDDGSACAAPGPLAWLSRTPLRQAARIAAPRPIGAAPGARSPLPPAATPATPLRGLRVVELGPFTAGPLATRYLSDLGADVIKVEPPGGERSRSWQPRAAHASHYFANYNCGKRSVELDLATPAGAAALRALLADADVFVQNLKPGALARLSIDLDALVAAQPRLIVCSISGYGRSATPAAALDMVVQAGAGLMALVDGPTDSGPLKTGFSYGDLTAAHVAAFAILAALVERDRSGRGQLIDIAMHDALVWLAQLGWPDIPGPSYAVTGDAADWTLRVAGEAPEPVLEVAAAVGGDDARRRRTLRPVRAGADDVWQVLASPHRWRGAPSDIGAFVAVAGSDNPRA